MVINEVRWRQTDVQYMQVVCVILLTLSRNVYFSHLVFRFQYYALLKVTLGRFTVIEGEVGLAAPEPGLGWVVVLLDGLVTHGPGLDPLGGLEVALGHVEAPGLQQRLPFNLCLSLERDFVLQKVNDLLIPRGCYLIFPVLEMFGSFVFENFSLEN